MKGFIRHPSTPRADGLQGLSPGMTDGSTLGKRFTGGLSTEACKIAVMNCKCAGRRPRSLRIGRCSLPATDRPAPEVGTRARVVALSADRKSTRLNSSHVAISYAVFCLKKKKDTERPSVCGD